MSPRDLLYSIAQFLLLFNHVQLFATPWTAACQASLSITNSGSLLRLISIELVMPSNHLILCPPLLSCVQSFPASGSFPMSHFFASGDQSIGVSFNISSSNEYSGLIPFRMDWLYVLQSKRLSRVFSNTTAQKHQLFGAQLSS